MALLKAATSRAQQNAPRELEKASKAQEKRLNVNLDVSTHERFRIACMRNGRTMKEEVEQFVADYLKKNPS
ncbi:MULTISPECIES: plasmid partition protein ParG [Pseudomonas syringae group]|uniref:DNA-cytosine methyltransferase n=3 Tax=Pseudomonas syringae group TaxID=136849 RepID=A0A0P9S8N4_PSEA0|nr:MULTISPECIES: plasmid partition protein ParG [Pseudomonas syringae group]KPX53133.1 hypothetical protein ALO53_200141 [Pseudomonas amygdali pv. photiniae]PIN57872.1 DNA partition complex ParG [Pseudomonas syringae pv. actinidiae]RML98065.1 hypothetical protein ALQ86_200159 [Pseudomonas amygdali pv. eriobotryae]RMS42480.1 hypothetical protein ALP66_01776 [Pseudomonas amygdali pv. photiniae]BBI47286.1 hypothetical protein KPSA1B_300034 [Pseudomonas syringae pv. actinidiae]